MSELNRLFSYGSHIYRVKNSVVIFVIKDT